MKKIIVASKNPVKVQAALKGFQEMFPEDNFEVQGIAVPSGVSDQPMGDKETFQGAWNRVQAAQEVQANADFWIGIEGGNIRHGENEMEVMAWIVIATNDQVGKARTAGFFLPPKIIELINQGYELGDADDIVFGTSNSKSSLGSGGLLTEGVIDRMRFYVPAVIFALIPFKQTELYNT
ncbi:MAG: inosine/xanthosine triphosphatase [Bacteroidota bacterium]